MKGPYWVRNAYPLYVNLGSSQASQAVLQKIRDSLIGNPRSMLLITP